MKYSFYDYKYYLDVAKQYELMPDVKPLEEGLKEAFDWYIENMDKVYKRSYVEYIEENLA